MEATRARLELCSLDAEEVKGLEVDDVEVAVTIHQHLRVSSVDGDRVDDKRVDAGGDDPVRVVIAIKGNGGARQVEVLRHRHPCCKNLPALPLALS